MDQQEEKDADKPSVSSLNAKEARQTAQEEMDEEIKVAAKRTRVVSSVATSTRVYYEPPTTRNRSTGIGLDRIERTRKMAAKPDSGMTAEILSPSTLMAITHARVDGATQDDTKGNSRTDEALQKDHDDSRELSEKKRARGRKRAKILQQELSASLAGPNHLMCSMDNSAQGISSRSTSPVPPNNNCNHGLASLENSARSHGSGRSQSPLPQPKAKKLQTSIHGLSQKQNSKSPPSTRSHSPVPVGARQKARNQHGLPRDHSQTQQGSEKRQRHGLCRENVNPLWTPTAELHPSATAAFVASRVPSDHTTLPSLQSRRAAYEAKFRPSSASSISTSGLSVSQFTLQTGSNHGSENEGRINPLGSSNELLVDTIMVPPEEDLKRQARQERANIAIEETISPGAYAEDGDGTHLVRNRNLRFSLVGLGALDLEIGRPTGSAASLGTREVTNNPAMTHDYYETDRTDPDDISIELSARQSSTTPTQSGLVEAVPVMDPSVLVADVEQVGSTELQQIANKEEINARRAFRKAASLTICGFLVLVGIMLIICFEVILKPGSDETGVPVGPPTPAPTPFLFDVPQYTADAMLESSATPQAHAYRWLMMDPNVESYPMWRLQQRFALATLFMATTSQDMASDGTIGHSWRNAKSWLLHEEHECQWYADSTIELAYVTVRMTSPCGEDGRYERLWLQNNNLHGTLPPEISLMTSLNSIALYENKLEGPVPSQLWQLPSLKHLILSLNYNLTGTIPPEIGSTDLEYFTAQYTSMTGTIPSEIGKLTDLNTLALDDNKFTGSIPSEVGLLPKIQYLLLSGNNLTHTIPTEVGLISSLGYLKLSANSLSGPIPTELALIPNFSYLNVFENQLTGTLPRELFYLTALQEIFLSNNSLIGTIPPEVGLMKKNSFHVDGNHLSGSLPSEIGLLHELNELILHNNTFTGPIPTQIGGLTGLKTLQFHQNGFNGTLPSEVGMMHDLIILSFSENQISGSFPSQIGKLTDLIFLNVSHCEMTGTIPSDIGQLTGLQWLLMQENHFSAPLPAEISLLGNLSDFKWST